jgi:hypothetical protein
MSDDQALEQVSFSRGVAGDPLTFRRVWATIVYDVKGYPVQVLVWQDGPWWCVTEKGEHGVFDSTWGNAQHVAQHITVRYGTPTGIDHIDFSL